MNRINGVRRNEFNNKKSQHNPLTEEQKLKNMIDGNGKVFLYMLEKILSDGGLTNANS